MSLPPFESPFEIVPRRPTQSPPKPRRRKTIPEVNVDPDAEVVDESTPWTWHDGWLWSIGAHGLILLILGLWYFTPKASQVRTFDSTLGSDLGRDDGLTALGGIDQPVSLPDPVAAPAVDSPTERIKPIDFLPDPMAGATEKATNVGVGNGDGFGVAKFGSGGESVRGVEVKVGDPQFTLIWNTPVDLDLYVTEPGGKTIWWNDRNGQQGGELDVDNTEGFGPENIYWLRQGANGAKELGPGPPGEYRWHVEYYGGNNGTPMPTKWKVRIKHAGKVEFIQGRVTYIKEKSKMYTLKVGDSTGGGTTEEAAFPAMPEASPVPRRGR